MGKILLAGVLLLFSVFSVTAERVSEADVQQVFSSWAKKSSHFKSRQTPFVRKSYSVKALEERRLDSSSMPFYVVELEPEGFVIMNSDKRLPPVLAYSDTGTLNLDDLPDNAFRALLKGSMERNYRKVMNLSSANAALNLLQPVEEAANEAEWEQLTGESAEDEPKSYGMGGVTNGPFLTTTWNQCNHYNELCPVDPGSPPGSYYDGRVPVGCVAVVGAQIMNYYEWPYRGSGSHTYTDDEGGRTGTYSADFSDVYDWGNMQDDYYAWGAEPADAVEAVSELMYEVGVAVEMDYDGNGSGAYSSDLNAMMERAFLYEEGNWMYDPGNSAGVADLIRADMLANRPAYVSISGHAIVADGHVDDGSNEYFHFNYGWGGDNDGWYLISDIAGDPAIGCVAGLYPAMIPVNRTESGQTNNSPHVSLEWAIADVRTAEVQSVSVLEHVLRTDTFADSADDFSDFEVTSTSAYKDWIVSSGGYSGNCFYKEPGGYSNVEYHFTSIEKFIPQSGTQLRFRLKTYLSGDVFRVMVSDDDGQTFSEIGSYDPGQTWTLITANLSAYIGSEILIRFEYVPGSYYPSGGVWLDDIEFSGGEWYSWDTQQVSGSLSGAVVSNLSEGVHTLCLQAFDGSAYGARSPSFSVVVDTSNDSDGDGLPNDWELQYFGGATNASPDAMASNGVNTVMQAYIAGLDPTAPESFFKASLTNEAGFVVRWNATSGRVYSVYGSTNLVDSFQPLETNILWPQSSWTDTVNRSESFYRVDVTLEE